MEQNNNEFNEDYEEEYKEELEELFLEQLDEERKSRWKDNWGVECLEDNEIEEILLNYINEKLNELYELYEECEGLYEKVTFSEEAKVLMSISELTNEDEPEIACKIEQVKYSRDEGFSTEIIMLLDVKINYINHIIKVDFYDMKNPPDIRMGWYTNGEMGSCDGVESPVAINEFDTREIDCLFDEIIGRIEIICSKPMVQI